MTDDDQEIEFWADKLAKNMVLRNKFNYSNKKSNPNKDNYSIKSSTSISGVPHIGNASDVFRAEAVVNALKDLGKKVHFFWVGEDMDNLRKVPAGIPVSFKKYLGQPVSEIPCPENCCDSYAEHFENLFINSLKDQFGVEVKFYSMKKEYYAGNFYELIKIALKNRNQIRDILNSFRDPSRPLVKNWMPWEPVCENCGKIITTKMLDIHDDCETVEYVCQDYQFEHALIKGCNYKGTSEIKKGHGKLPWKVEWAAQWKRWNVDFEPFGKEHGVNCPRVLGVSKIGAGSFWVAGNISESVYEYPEPCPTVEPNVIQPYEYVLIGNEKMSASKGNTIATWDWPNFAPPETLRLFFLKKPKSQSNIMTIKKIGNNYRLIDKEFDIQGLIDEIDELAEVYFGIMELEEDAEKIKIKKRLYEICMNDKIPEDVPRRIPFKYAIIMCQLNDILSPEKIMENAIEVVKKKYVVEELTDIDIREIRLGLDRAAHWVKKFAPTNIIIRISKEIDENFVKTINKNQIDALTQFKEDFSQRIWDEDSIQNYIFKLGKNVVGNVKKTFQLFYKILINKKYGPRLGPFLLSLDKDWIIDRIEKAMKIYDEKMRE
ncbi:MAG: lysine--tRNA ligase [Promethearchaeota archaeon]|nr:MAG: lysine--tRNA ligase [Candidatus Lokiarchaeota archaeon]